MSSEYFLKLDRAFNAINSVFEGELQNITNPRFGIIVDVLFPEVCQCRLSANQALNCITVTVGFHGKGFYTDTNEEKRDKAYTEGISAQLSSLTFTYNYNHCN